jgi:hypothetical protein
MTATRGFGDLLITLQSYIYDRDHMFDRDLILDKFNSLHHQAKNLLHRQQFSVRKLSGLVSLCHMAKRHQQDQQNLTFDEMMRFLDSEFQRFPEHQAGNAVRYELADVLCVFGEEVRFGISRMRQPAEGTRKN